jgi:hypothetical protein
MNDAMAQMQALPTVLAAHCAHPQGRAGLIPQLRTLEGRPAMMFMKYLSTRGHPDRKHFCDILLEGLAPDGGLYLPEHYPQVDDATLTPLAQGLPRAGLRRAGV